MGVKVREKDGKWYVFINHMGKRKAKCVGDSKKAALEVKRKLEAKLTLGEFDLLDDKPKVPTFREYAEKWLQTYVRHNLKESTYERYTIVVRGHLLPTFGNKSLSEISREDVKQLIYDKRNTHKLAGVKLILAPLHHILTHAIEDEIIATNPAARVGRFLQERQEIKQEINPFTREELAQFLDTVQTQFPGYYPLFLCLARTGMRIGEALGLQWGDVDFQGRFIDIRRNAVRRKITTLFIYDYQNATEN